MDSRANSTDTGHELKRPPEMSLLTMVLFLVCIGLAASSAFFYARSTGESVTREIAAPPTSEAAVMQAQVAQLVRSQEQLVNVIVAMLGISATMVTVVLVLASYLFDRRNRNVIEELNSALAAERMFRIENERTLRQELEANTRRLEKLDARLEFAPPMSSGPNPVVVQDFNRLRDTLISRIADSPDVEKDVYMLLTAAREINGLEPGQGIRRDEVADLLFRVKQAAETGRWDEVLSEYYEFGRAVMNFVGNVEEWEYMAGVSLGPAKAPETSGAEQYAADSS